MRALGHFVLTVVIAIPQLGWPQPAAGPPASIELVVKGGTDQVRDNQRAEYRPHSHLDLEAIVRDANGQVVQGCTPAYTIANEVAANRAARAVLYGANHDHVEFLDEPGPFTVAVHCLEDPSITSENNHAPLNFETSTGTFARSNASEPPAPPPPQPPGQPPLITPNASATVPAQPPPAQPPPAPHRSHAGRTLLIVTLAIAATALVYVGVYELSGGIGSSDTYCVRIIASTNGSCPVGDYPYATQDECLSGPMGYQYLQSLCTCHVASCSVTFSPDVCSPCPTARAAPIRNVDELVTRGFATSQAPRSAVAPSQQRWSHGPREIAAPLVRLVLTRPVHGAAAPALHFSHPARGAAPATIARTSTPRSAEPPAQPAAQAPSRWLDVGVAALSIAVTSYAVWSRMQSPSRVEVAPWITPDSGGASITVRF